MSRSEFQMARDAEYGYRVVGERESRIREWRSIDRKDAADAWLEANDPGRKRRCQECGENFKPTRSDKRFHNANCRARHNHRNRPQKSRAKPKHLLLGPGQRALLGARRWHNGRVDPFLASLIAHGYSYATLANELGIKRKTLVRHRTPPRVRGGTTVAESIAKRIEQLTGWPADLDHWPRGILPGERWAPKEVVCQWCGDTWIQRRRTQRWHNQKCRSRGRLRDASTRGRMLERAAARQRRYQVRILLASAKTPAERARLQRRLETVHIRPPVSRPCSWCETVITARKYNRGAPRLYCSTQCKYRSRKAREDEHRSMEAA